MSEDLHWISDWKLDVKVCVERAGQLVLGKGRLQLLEAIDRCHSISAAAREMGMSYRRAWLLVQSVNEGAGEPFVEKSVGGTQGGGARLTSRGKQAIEVFRELRCRVAANARTLVPRAVETWEVTPVVHVAAAISLQEVLGQLLADYAIEQPDVRVRVVFGASNELAEHLMAGAPGQLFITAHTDQLERLAVLGVLSDEPPLVLAENRLVAVVNPQSGIKVKRAADLLCPAIGRIALADPRSPIGRLSREYLAALGLWEAFLAKAPPADSSRGVLSAVRSGRAAAGLVYSSDAGATAGFRVLFRPRRTEATARYTAALIRGEQDLSRARHLLAFLASPPATTRFKECGFAPIGSTAR